MSDTLLLLDHLQEELGKFRNLPLVPWEQANRRQLVERMETWQSHTRQVKELLTLLQIEQLKNPILKNVDLKKIEMDVRQNDEILARNVAFEKDKTNRKIDLTEKISTPTTGAELEARMHKQWQAIQRMQEQLHISLRQSMGESTTAKAIEGELFSLVRTKNEELQAMTQERDKLKREKYFGPVEKQSITDMENEMQDLLQTFAIEKHAVFDHLERGKKKLDEYHTHHTQLEYKTKKFEHLVQELTKKHMTMLTMLKKERDYARKLALDLEGETASLRALYSRELLTLDEKKHALRQEVEEKHIHKVGTLEKKVKEQEYALKEMDALIREKERQIQRMAEKLPAKEKEAIPQKNTKKMVS